MAKAARRSRTRGRPVRRSRVGSRLNSRSRTRVGSRLNSRARSRARSSKKKRGKKRSKKVGGDGTGLSISESIGINISELSVYDWLDHTNGYTLKTLFDTILGGIINIEDNKNIFPEIPDFQGNEIFNEIPSDVNVVSGKVTFKIGVNQFILEIKEETSDNKIIIHILREKNNETLYNNTIDSIEITKPKTAPVAAQRKSIVDIYKNYFLQIIASIKQTKQFNGETPHNKKAKLIRSSNYKEQSIDQINTDHRDIEYDKENLTKENKENISLDTYYFIKNLNDPGVKAGTKNIAGYYSPDLKQFFHFKKMKN